MRWKRVTIHQRLGYSAPSVENSWRSPACRVAHHARSRLCTKCPRCKIGTIEGGSPIRWQLDAGWENLPVPTIVKDLVTYANERRLPSSLQQAADAVDDLGKYTFIVVVLRLLDWWEGDYLSPGREQKESVALNARWTWCQALPAVLGATPMLDDLVCMHDGRC
jgi:hypothetical protein